MVHCYSADGEVCLHLHPSSLTKQPVHSRPYWILAPICSSALTENHSSRTTLKNWRLWWLLSRFKSVEELLSLGEGSLRESCNVLWSFVPSELRIICPCFGEISLLKRNSFLSISAFKTRTSLLGKLLLGNHPFNLHCWTWKNLLLGTISLEIPSQT